MGHQAEIVKGYKRGLFGRGNSLEAMWRMVRLCIRGAAIRGVMEGRILVK